jgi:hypothetical protein
VEYEPTVSDYWNTMPTEEPKRKSENQKTRKYLFVKQSKVLKLFPLESRRKHYRNLSEFLRRIIKVQEEEKLRRIIKVQEEEKLRRIIKVHEEGKKPIKILRRLSKFEKKGIMRGVVSSLVSITDFAQTCGN